MPGLAMTTATAQAFARFGLGGRPDDALPADPVKWLMDQLAAADPTPVARMPTTADGLALLYDELAQPVGSVARANAATKLSSLVGVDIQALLANAVTTKAPFRERLVWFWANHFAIMIDDLRVGPTACPYVREAIRPHVTGLFSDMLVAVMSHPAMICSLGNQGSTGPQSPHALQVLWRRGPQLNINENLARETLELYTVGVAAGYTQADVIAMAYLLTGWTVSMTPGQAGFIYDPTIAQPGHQTLMGVTYPNTQAGCIAALKWLGTHPATYNHIATKLVTHFVSDTPDPADVATIANALAATRGSLLAAERALVSLPSAWRPLVKLRTPMELVVATLRAIGATAATVPTISTTLGRLGQPIFKPPFPNGWSDLAADWASPGAIDLRMGWLRAFCRYVVDISPAAVVAAALGPFLSANTAAVAGQATTVTDQLTLLLSSPEFQRR